MQDAEHRHGGLHISSYQAVSGSGLAGVDTLFNQLDQVGDDRAEVVIHVAGDPDRVVEVDDPTLEPVTVADAADAAKHVVGRWIEGYLGRTPIAPRPFPGHQGQPRPVDER